MLERYQRIPVTGGCGFIGRHLAGALVSLGKSVTVLDNLSTAFDISTAAGTHLVNIDLREQEQLAAAVEHADLIVHAAANSSGTVSIEDPRFDFETNVVGTLNLLDAAVGAGTKRFVQIASASVYGIPRYFAMDEEHPTKPLMPYGTSKLTAERYALTYHSAYGLYVVVGWPFCVMAPANIPR